MSSEWYQHNNMAVKLRNALDAVIDGHGLPYIFKGLDTGKCSVEITYNGETCTFCAKNPTLNEAKPVPSEMVIKPVIEEAQDTAELDEDPQFTVAPKRGRKPRIAVETVPVGNGVSAEL